MSPQHLLTRLRSWDFSWAYWYLSDGWWPHNGHLLMWQSDCLWAYADPELARPELRRKLRERPTLYKKTILPRAMKKCIFLLHKFSIIFALAFIHDTVASGFGYGLMFYTIYHEFHETCHSVTFYFMKKDSKWWCNTSTPKSIHTKDESKRGSAFAFIFGVNWPVQSM